MKARLLPLLALILLLTACVGSPIPTDTPISVGLPTATVESTPAATATLPATVPPTAAPTSTTASSPTVALSATTGAIPVYSYRAEATYPHDPQSFIEGLVLDGDILYEGTGLYGQSELREVRLSTGEVLRSTKLPPAQFGEGVALIGERLVQLTWQDGIGYVWNRADFAPLGTFNYPGEGWGLTTDGTRLIMSDGTAAIRFLDPTSFAEIGRITVTDETGPVTQLNELEYVGGSIYANIWYTDRIAKIDPSTGRVTAWLDLTGVAGADRPASSEGVLNGITYDPATDRLLITGKYWPKLYSITILDAAGQVVSPAR